MARVTITFSLDIANEAAFIAQADERVQMAWGNALDDLVMPGDDRLAVAVYETFIASNGEPWPDGTADDANTQWSGTVER